MLKRQEIARVVSARLGGVSLTVATVCMVALASGGLVGILASQAYDEYERIEEVASISSRNATEAMAEHARATFRGASARADAAVRSYNTSGTGGLGVNNLDLHSGNQGWRSVIVAGSDGSIKKVYGTASLTPAQAKEISGVHADKPQASEIISRPVRLHPSGEWVVTLSRKVRAAVGSSSDVVIVTIPVSEFTSFYERLQVGPGAALVLASDKGVMYARFPSAEGSVGMNLSGTPLFRELVPNYSSGSVALASSIDGVERLLTYSKVRDLPLVVLAGPSMESMIDEWETRIKWRAIGVAVLFGCLLLMGLHIQGRIRKSQEDEARLAKAHVELEELNKELEKLVMLDALTGLGNRRRFDQTIAAEFSRAMRNGSMLALIMIDVDFFKRYNDLYGHPEGDKCLRIVAAVVQASQSRPGDLAVRYGGEEMAVLLPHTDAAGAITVAEKIRKAVENLRVPHEGNPLGVVTVSIGVNAFVPVRFGHTLQQLIDSADKALYEAKASGRNRVCVGTPIEASVVPV